MNLSAIQQFAKGTTTPLASIFGSGFLVIVPVLASTVGPYSLFAMAGVCLLAYLVGAVIRYNIANAEPVLAGENASHFTRLTERIADIALVPAYIISITLYLRILSSYALAAIDKDSDLNERWLTTAIILIILMIGLTKGLEVLESLEKKALYATLVLICVIILAFAVYDIGVITNNALEIIQFPDVSAWHVLTVLAGTLIVVQGFETTRYLGDEYDSETRIRASRNSQILSTVIYLAFIAVATPLMHFLVGDVSDNGLMKLVGIVASWLVFPLVMVAIFSQFSAATADMIGASGNMLEFSNHTLTKPATYLIVAGFALVLTWTADTLQILALASRAFAFYYLLQCLVAFSVAKKSWHKVCFLLLSAVMLFITLFAVPVG